MFAILGTLVGVTIFFLYSFRHFKSDMRDAEALDRLGVYGLIFRRGMKGALYMLPFPIAGAILDWLLGTGLSSM